MLLEDRKQLLKDNNICNRCLASTNHQAKDCKVTVKYEECNREKHLAAHHPGPEPSISRPPSYHKKHDGEQANAQDLDVTAICTEVCGNEIKGKSCSKICLVQVYPKDQLNDIRTMYTIIDDQSNQTLARTEFFDIFNIQVTTSPYTLKTCAGVMQVTGRRACYIVTSFVFLFQCNAIPNNRE